MCNISRNKILAQYKTTTQQKSNVINLLCVRTYCYAYLSLSTESTRFPRPFRKQLIPFTWLTRHPQYTYVTILYPQLGKILIFSCQHLSHAPFPNTPNYPHAVSFVFITLHRFIALKSITTSIPVHISFTSTFAPFSPPVPPSVYTPHILASLFLAPTTARAYTSSMISSFYIHF